MQPIPSAKELLAAARAKTGLADAGDPRFTTALGELVQSVNAESDLTPEGRDAAIERWQRLLVNRLRIESDLTRHPEIGRTGLLPPLIIGGLPRVGSTKLHQLLAKTGDFQSLLFWQGYNPARPQTATDNDADPRIADAVRFLDWRTRRNPLSNAAHFLAAAEPEEDTYLLEFTLHSYWPVSYFEVKGFLAWLAKQDRDHAYAYLATLLKYLQWQFHSASPRPWVLKSPPNLGYEAEMARHLPGARFVMLHRDPIESIPSTVAIVRELRRLYGSGAGDLREVGAWAMAEYSSALARNMQWRATLPAQSVLDLRYADIRDDYETSVSRVYDFCGMELSATAIQRMQAWAGDNEQHKHGVHQYTLDEAGLSEAAIRRQFAPYISAFERYF